MPRSPATTTKSEYYPSGTPANDAFGAHLRFVNRALHAYNFEDHDQAYRAALLDSLIGSSARNLAANTDNIFGVAMVDGVIHYDKDISRAGSIRSSASSRLTCAPAG